MNILDQMATAVDKKAQKPIALISPLPNPVSDDGFLQYKTVEKLSDVTASPGTGTVLCFNDDETGKQLLKCLTEFPDLFDFSPVVLTGVANAEYSTNFESATWAFEKLGYHSVIADAVEFKRRKELLDAESKNPGYEKERSRWTRSNGNVKELTKVGVRGVVEDDIDTAEDEGSAT